MNKTSTSKLFVIVFSIVLMIASAIHAKQPAGSEPQPGGLLSSAAQDPKPGEQKSPAGQKAQPPADTLQILKGTPRPQIVQQMNKIAESLGVKCNFCHMNPFPVDTPRKAVARLMMRDYTMGMKHKDGSALTCNDCHKGEVNFLRTRPFEGVVGKELDRRQVLKGMPRDRLTQMMNDFSTALGVECDYCHLSHFDEVTSRMQIARFMMTQFTQGLVKQDGSPVGCNDCHQGNARPLSVLPFPRKPEPPPAKKPAD